MFRFAPSPTADMHIGTLRVALFNYICAKQADDKLLIRIEDTDLEHHVEGKDQEILEILTLFGISYHDVTYQSHNRKFHQQLATKLLMDKNAFSCFCTSNDIAKGEPYNGTCENLSDEMVLNNENPFSVRVKRPQEDISFEESIKGEMHVKKESIDSFVILHQDKTPTPNFASALDDLLSDISLVIRSEEHLSDTPKQVMLRNYLGYDKSITYAHLPALVNAPSVKELLEEGFLTSAITNYLIMIGNETPSDIFDLTEAMAWFDLSKLSTSSATFDINTLRHINHEHIQKMDALELAKFLSFSSKDLGELAKIYSEEGSTINEIKPKIDALFAKKAPSEFITEYQSLVKIAKDAPFFKAFEDFQSHLQKKSGLEGKAFLEPLRFMLTGADSGPNLSDIYPHIKNYLGEIIQ